MLDPVIKQAVDFTDTYKKYKNAPVPIREAMCLRTVYPASLPQFRGDDIFAGRCSARRITHVGTMRWYGMPWYTPEKPDYGKHGGYCFDYAAPETMKDLINDEEKTVLVELAAFWRREASIIKVHAQTDLRDGVGFLCPNDLDALVAKGLPGIASDVAAMEEGDFRTGLQLALEAVGDTIRYYLKHAEETGRASIAANLSSLLTQAPATLYEALQLILLFELLTHERHYEMHQLDVALGDLYAGEIDGGTLNEAQAIEMICAFYRMINENGDATVCRLVLGGRGRRNEANADRFIAAALKAEQRHKRVTPQVTLRIYDGMDPGLLDLAYETINEVGTFPMLFNDDAIIAGVAEAYGISLKEAEDYYPCGCGEIIIAPHSPALLVVAWDIPRAMDEAIRSLPARKAETFGDLYRTVVAKYADEAEIKARYHRLVVDTHNGNNAFLMASLLINDCVRRGKPVLNGGARYNGGVIMGHGFTNAGDALTAIKKVVYGDKTLSLADLLRVLDTDFADGGDIRKALLAAPKYGNDDGDADATVSGLWRDISGVTKKAGVKYGFDFLTVSSVNPGGYDMGKGMGATADGRLRHTPYAIGNAPTAGADKNGLTALMNSILTTNRANGGTMTNFKVSRAFFRKNREKFESLFAVYWAGGGQQANITIVNPGDLEAALEAPEKFPHLMVRLGGWTARFIDLDAYVQKEIMERTLH
jgi:pyruvate-formate lyase